MSTPDETPERDETAEEVEQAQTETDQPESRIEDLEPETAEELASVKGGRRVNLYSGGSARARAVGVPRVAWAGRDAEAAERRSWSP